MINDPQWARIVGGASAEVAARAAEEMQAKARAVGISPVAPPRPPMSKVAELLASAAVESRLLRHRLGSLSDRLGNPAEPSPAPSVGGDGTILEQLAEIYHDLQQANAELDRIETLI